MSIAYLTNRQDCEDILNKSSLMSNREDYLNAFHQSFQYEENRTTDKNRIFGVKLQMLFPRGATIKDCQMFLKRYLGSLTKGYDHDLPYVFWLEDETKNAEKKNYLYVLCGQRKVYDVPQEVMLYRKRTCYRNKITNKWCKKSDPEAIELVSNTPLVDENDNPKTKWITVSEVKDRTFNYKDSLDSDLKKVTFKEFTERLKRLVKRILESMYKVQSKLPESKLHTIAMSNFDKPIQKAKIIRFNIALRKFRSRLGKYRFFYEYSKKIKTDAFSKNEIDELKERYIQLSNQISTIMNTQYLKEPTSTKGKDNIYNFPVRLKSDNNKKGYKNLSFKSWEHIFRHAIRYLEKECEKFESKTIYSWFACSTNFWIEYPEEPLF